MTRGKIRMVEIIEAANGYLVVCGGFVETKFADITNLYCRKVVFPTPAILGTVISYEIK